MRTFPFSNHSLLSNKVGASLIFNRNPFVYNSAYKPFFGHMKFKEAKSQTLDSVLDLFHTQQIQRVVFFNPYFDPYTLKIYQGLRKLNYSYYVCERGALNNSIFIDPNGFNVDSKSYSPYYWDQALSVKKQEQVKQYIQDEKKNSEALEKQPNRLNSSDLLKQLDIANKKILFVPFQRPTDTVIRFFSKGISSFDNFINLIKSLTEALPRDWVIVAKRHPLEQSLPTIKNIVWANQVHFKDLLQIADATLTINSGVGVYSLLYGLPTIAAGQAFYTHPGLAQHHYEVEPILEFLKMQKKPKTEKIHRFISYLIHDFYSFAKFSNQQLYQSELKQKITYTSTLEFEKICIPNLGVFSVN